MEKTPSSAKRTEIRMIMILPAVVSVIERDLRKNFSASHRKRIPTIIFSTNGIKDGWHAMNMTTRSGTNRNRTFACRSEAGISFPQILNILQVSHEIAPTAAVYPMMW